MRGCGEEYKSATSWLGRRALPGAVPTSYRSCPGGRCTKGDQGALGLWFHTQATRIRDKKPPPVKYPTLYEDRVASRQRVDSCRSPLCILLLAGTAYLHRDFLRTWFEEDVRKLEQVREKLTGDNEHEKAK